MLHRDTQLKFVCKLDHKILTRIKINGETFHQSKQKMQTNLYTKIFPQFDATPRKNFLFANATLKASLFPKLHNKAH